MMAHPCTTNVDHFTILHAPSSDLYASRIREVAAGRLDLIAAQEQNVQDGYEVGEIVHTSRGWGLANHLPALGGTAWHTAFAHSREVALIAAQAWHAAFPESREVIMRKP